MNPVKAGMVVHAGDYRFSSMKEFFSVKDPLIHPDSIQLVKQRFCDRMSFDDFHGKRKYEIFQDIYEEMEQQRIEIAERIAREMYAQARMNYLSQVFDSTNTACITAQI